MRRTACVALGLATAIAIVAPHPARAFDLDEMSQQFDRASSAELESFLKKARSCASSYDFPCSEKSIGRARKLVVEPAQRDAVAKAERFLKEKREELAAEERRIAERRIAEEKRRREAEDEENRRYWARIEAEETAARNRKRAEEEAKEQAYRDRRAQERADAAADMARAWQSGGGFGGGGELARMRGDIAKGPDTTFIDTARRVQAERDRQAQLDRERKEEDAREARREREQAERDRQARERQERERRERQAAQRQASTSTGSSASGGSVSRPAETRPIAIFITYRNPNGYWFTWGPYNETSGEGEKKGERDSWRVIIGDEPATFVGPLGRYNLWKLHRPLKPWEKDLRDRLHREGLSPEALDPTL